MIDFSGKIFHSPTHGELTAEEIVERVKDFMVAAPQRHYRIIIGSDSQARNRSGVDYVTALVIHREGCGGIYFWRREHDSRKFVLRDRIYKEATLSLEFANHFLKIFRREVGETFNLEIHIDIGTNGDTRELITEVVGMIRGSGFDVKIKPESYGASSVADKYA